jgi:hypothetical protein
VYVTVLLNPQLLICSAALGGTAPPMTEIVLTTVCTITNPETGEPLAQRR